MATFRALAAASLLSMGAAANLISHTVLSTVVSDIVPSPTCNGNILATMGSEYCCPGVFQATDTPNGAYCCVGPTDLPLSRFSDCFPNCGVTSTTTTSTDAATQSCATTIMINDPNYSSEVNALGATATPVGSSQPISEHSTINSIPTGSATVTESSGSAASTTGSSSSAASSSASSAGSSSSASGASASSTGTSSSKGLAARITGIPFAGAFMLAGGIAVAAM